MKTFLKACACAKQMHGVMMKHFRPNVRRSIVKYWYPN